MIGIDRYTLRQPMPSGTQRHAASEEKGGQAAASPPVQLSGGSQGGTSSTSKLSAAFWSIQSAGKGSEDGTGTPEDQFTRLSRMSLAERIREQILEKHQLTEAGFRSLEPSERKAIEAEIRKAILEAYGADGARKLRPDGEAPAEDTPAGTTGITTSGTDPSA